MLVLSRDIFEVIVIETSDGLIEVTPTRIGGGRVRLGVTAPPNCRILRKEVYAMIDSPVDEDGELS